jgi:hypothetical protein
MVSLPADVPSYFVEELSELFPSCVVYRVDDEQEIWFNADRVFDSLVIATGKMMSLRDFIKSFSGVTDDAVRQGILPDHCYCTRPSNQESRTLVGFV